MAPLAARTASHGDVDAIVELNERVFQRAKMTGWERHHVEAHLDTFQEGQLVVEIDDAIVASSTSLLVPKGTLEDPHTWMSITGGAELPHHAPDGDVLYGLEIMVHPDARGWGLSQMLYRARKVLARKRGLWGVAIGGRMPGYDQATRKRPHLPPERYVDQVQAGDRTDPVLTPQLSAGFTPERVLENYVIDPPSQHHAALLVWEA